MMKTTINIPDDIMNEVMKYAQTNIKTEAIIIAVNEYIQKRKMAKLAAKLGTMENLISHKELMSIREKN